LLLQIGFRLADGELQLGVPRVAQRDQLLKLPVYARYRRRSPAAGPDRKGQAGRGAEVVRLEVEVIAAVSIEKPRVLNLRKDRGLEQPVLGREHALRGCDAPVEAAQLWVVRCRGGEPLSRRER